MLHKISWVITTWLTLLLGTKIGQSANILFYFGTSTFSHRIAVWPLVEALAERGHQVTFVCPFAPINKNPKVTEFTPKFMIDFNYTVTKENMLQLRLEGRQSLVWESVPWFAKLVCEFTLKDPEVKDWIDRSKFDLVVLGSFFNECGLAMAYKWKAKFAIFSPASHLMWYGDEFGHSPESSWIPELDLQFPHRMNFFQRVYNTLRPLYYQFWFRHFNYLPEAEKIIRKNLDVPDMPDLATLWRNTSLVMVNTHFSFEFARSLPPLYVSVGGIHIQPSKSVLSKELTNFINGNGEQSGFIYFSFGSVAKSSSFPKELLQVFYDVFKQFQYTRFVWTFDAERPQGMPENVLTVKWAPQHALLGHPKIKGFITQAGAMSLQETIHFKVPAILFPLFGDQDNNAESLARNGCGIKLEIRGLQRETLRNAISDILTNKRYKTRITQVSEIFKDREQTPLETALWWTEFILRHDDVSHLKPLSMNQSWYEIRLLDVWLFVFTVLFAIFSTLICVLSFCCFRKSRLTKDKLKRS